MRLGRRITPTSEFSRAFWFTQQRRLLAKKGQNATECTDHSLVKRVRTGLTAPRVKANSHSLRVAVCSRLTAQISIPL